MGVKPWLWMLIRTEMHVADVADQKQQNLKQLAEQLE